MPFYDFPRKTRNGLLKNIFPQACLKLRYYAAFLPLPILIVLDLELSFAKREYILQVLTKEQVLTRRKIPGRESQKLYKKAPKPSLTMPGTEGT